MENQDKILDVLNSKLYLIFDRSLLELFMYWLSLTIFSYSYRFWENALSRYTTRAGRIFTHSRENR